MNKYRWTQNETDVLIKWYPHYGGTWVAKQLNISLPIIRRKADHLKISMFPRNKRLCTECQRNYINDMKRGYRCKDCYNKRRSSLRRLNGGKTLISRIKEILRTLKYRNKGEFNVSMDFLLEQFAKQDGLCFYSKIKMTIPNYGM